MEQTLGTALDPRFIRLLNDATSSTVDSIVESTWTTFGRGQMRQWRYRIQSYRAILQDGSVTITVVPVLWFPFMAIAFVLTCQASSSTSADSYESWSATTLSIRFGMLGKKIGQGRWLYQSEEYQREP